MMRILVTGGAGFIGSNLIDHLLDDGHKVVCLDNLSTGYERNIKHHYANRNFKFIKADIRDIVACKEAIKGCDLVSHQAALGSVPRSISDPVTTNEVNISGFLNLLVAARDEKVSRFVYAASSSTYGDSTKLPKVEDQIGKPLSPYAITKYVNELYAEVFAKTYSMQCIGLRYFNVFGKRQDPDGGYAAVIPLWVKQLLNNESPIINGDGTYSRDFTYINNVIHANTQALFTPSSAIFNGQVEYYNLELEQHKYTLADTSSPPINRPTEGPFSEVFNIAFGGNTTLAELFLSLRENLAKHDSTIKNINPIYGVIRPGDIPHSQASIIKAQTILGYDPQFDTRKGFEAASEWYYRSLQKKH
jgi:UDP-N-acetylglucosamine/UDP-N-acetylgalactosamine 4-epimerase